MRCFYFGVWSRDKLGHFLYDPRGFSWSRLQDALPFQVHVLDGGLLPTTRDQVEGRLHRAVINGWTVVGFWDRSGDPRPSANSSFVVEGEHPTAAVLAAARDHFPAVLARLPFPLVEA